MSDDFSLEYACEGRDEKVCLKTIDTDKNGRVAWFEITRFDFKQSKSGEGFAWSECGLICNEDDQVDCDCDMNPETTTIPPRMDFF